MPISSVTPLAVVQVVIAGCLVLAALGCQSKPKPQGLRISATNHGAIGNGTTLNTPYLQSVIDYLAAEGGGTLVLPAGTFLSGALYFKPGVHLHLEKDAVLLGSKDLKDYPISNTRIEGRVQPWVPALINIHASDGVRLTGEGTIDGNGEDFWMEFRTRREKDNTTKNLDVPRPRLLLIQNSNRVRISGLKFKDSAFWNIHLYRCAEVVIERVDIRAPKGAHSSDGIDLDSCQHVLIRDSYIANDDDCIALKGTKGPFAMQDASSEPVEHIRIENCTFAAGHGVLTCGSEATIVRDVAMNNCRVIGTTSNVLRLKLRGDTPQLYEDIHLRNITLDGTGRLISIQPWMQYFDLQGQPPPKRVVRNISASNITGTFGSMGYIKPGEGDTVENVEIKHVNVELTGDQPGLQTSGLLGVRLKNVIINGTRQE